MADKALEKAEKRLEAATKAAQDAAEEARTRSERCLARTAERAVEAAAQHLEKVQRSCSSPEQTTEPPGLPEHRIQADKQGNPKPSAQRNFTDPDSRIMKSGTDYIQGYNCQAVVDEGHQLIVALAVTN
jgi:hypothetical protein